ncbi:MAG: tetratricopeptide repeat protein [Vicinamibacterales bacterium]
MNDRTPDPGHDATVPDAGANRYARLKDIVTRALARPREQHRAFLDEACAGDEALRRDAEALLGQDASLDVLRTAAFGAPPVLDTSPDHIGPYHIHGVLGEGGMGVVYRARQDAPVRRDVALKVIRQGMDSARIVARFALERQTLARMDHPNVARLYDAGATDDGRPFFAMELVDGQPITRAAETRGLDLQARLALFVDVCRGVRHAHQKGVIHRDLKPSNILVADVDGRPVPKIIDFGIAKAIDVEAGDLTMAGRAPGTPAYMSPEQAGVSAAPIDTRTDVYALGVVLYELLAGRPPWRFESGTPAELYRVLHDATATRPSAIRPGVPRMRPADLAGDLDSIVLKAIEGDPERRYASVEQLLEDLERYRQGRPVEARAGTWSYRAGKFVGRHRLATTAAAVLTIVVLAFTAITVWQSRLLVRERDAAVLAGERARANADFLERLFRTANPREAGNRNMTAFDLLRAGVAQLDADASLDPRVKAEMYLTLGLALANLDEFDAGIAALRRGLEASIGTYGRESLETAEHLHRLGDILRQHGERDEAFALLNEALAIRQRLTSGDSYEIADSYNNIAMLGVDTGRYREADELQTRSVAMHLRLTGPDSPEIAVPLNNLSLVKRRQGRLEEALALARRAWAILQNGDDQGSALLARQNIATILDAMGQPAAAEAIYLELIEQSRDLLGPDHSRVLSLEDLVATTRQEQGDLDGAAARFAALEPRIRRVLGDDAMLVTVVMRDRGLLDRARGDLPQAERRLREALGRHLAATGPHHFRIPSFRRALADVLADRGQLAESEAQLRLLLTELPAADDYPYLERALALRSLARTLDLQGRPGEAAAARREAAEVDAGIAR